MKNLGSTDFLMKLPTLFALAVLAGAGPAWAGGTVTNLTQAALQTALAGGGTVLFGVSGTLTLTNTLTIAQDTVLDANGLAVTISGGGAGRLFQVATNATFAVNGLTLADGRFVGANGADGDPPAPGQDGSGAGILNLGGTVNLTGCTLTNHFVQGGNAGRDAANPSNNTGLGGNGLGAALCNLGGSVNLTNCTLTANAAQGGQGSAAPSYALGYPVGNAGGAWGGAIYSAVGTLNLQKVTLRLNGATGGSPQAIGGGVDYGGAGSAAGGALFALSSVVYIGGSLLASNAATGATLPFNGGPPASAFGGALFLSSNSSGLIQGSDFFANSASGGGSRMPEGGVGDGGAVFVGGTLQVFASTFSSNNAAGGRGTPGAAGQGGALCSTNALLLSASTFDGNQALGGVGAYGAAGAGEGGALWSSGLLGITNCTFAINTATGGVAGQNLQRAPGGAGRGGAVFLAGGAAALLNVTVASNRVDGGIAYFGGGNGPSQGGGLANTNGAVTVRGSIIADSANGGEVWGILTDAGYNLCSDNTANFSATGSLNNTDPLLAVLNDNGGPTETMALLAGSPARDAIPSGFPPTDQRGVARPQGPAADLGAFEANYSASRPTIVTNPISQTKNAGTTATFTIAASGPGPLNYQWRKDSVGLVEGGNISGMATPVLRLSNVLGADAGGYSVVISNSSGSVTSTVATLTVIDPFITSQPVGQSRSAGENMTFSVAAAGTPPLLYQWRKDAAALGGATNASLTLTNVQAIDAGRYDVVVASSYGSVTSTGAVLTVIFPLADSFNPGASSDVESLAIQADGKILAGGYFTTLGGQSRWRIGRLYGDGAIDLFFNPGASNWIYSPVYSLAVQPGGMILVGGQFATLGGQSSTNLGRLNPDGSLDASFQPGTGTSYPDTVYSLGVQADGKILVGGWFTRLGGQSRTNLGRLSADGSIDSSFNPGAGTGSPSGNQGVVFCLAVQADGKILVGGTFGTLGGQARSSIGRLNPDGSLDTSFHPGANGPVYSLTVQADQKILVGGYFFTLGGMTRNYIGRLNSDGSLDLSFNPGADDVVNSLAVQADGKILVAGRFTKLGGQNRNYIARLNADGSVDPSFNPGTDGAVWSLAVQADGKVLAGGAFTTLGGQSRSRIGRLNNTGPATQSLTFDTATITWLRGGTAPEVWRTTFDSSTNGVDWTALGAGVRIAGDWQLSGLTLPNAGTIRARGFVTGGQYNGSSWYVETQTQIPPKLTVVGLGPGGFRFAFPSVGGVSYVTEFCGDLAASAWTILEQRTGRGGLETVEDPSPGPSRRFYRVVTP